MYTQQFLKSCIEDVKDLFFFNITCCSFNMRSSPFNKPQIQMIQNIKYYIYNIKYNKNNKGNNI